MRSGKGEQAVQVLLAGLKCICYLALFLGMQVLVMMPVTLAAILQDGMTGGLVDDDALLSTLTEYSMVYSFLSGMLTIAFVLVFYLIRRKKLSEALWLRRVPAPTLWVGAAVAPGLYVLVVIVLSILPSSWQDSYSEASSNLDGGGLFAVLAIALVAPVVEEFIFRGLIMTRLSRAMPSWLAVLLSAAIFGACHVHPVWFAYAFVLGTVFGFMDLRAGSILPSILGHVAFNSIGQIFSFLPESESGMGEIVALGIFLVVGITAPILDRKAIAAMFRPAPKAAPAQELPTAPATYEFDPWDE